MRVTVLLADAAQADTATGKVHILGAGWTATSSPLPQHAIVALVGVPPESAEDPHQLRVTLVDQYGKAVGAQVEGGPTPHIVGTFKVQKPAGHVPGTAIHLPLVIQVPGGIVLPAGKFTWQLEIDNRHDEQWSVEFTVREASPAQRDPTLS